MTKDRVAGLRDDKLAKVGFRKIGVGLMLCICGDAVCGGWFPPT